jgi:hypothetical protein
MSGPGTRAVSSARQPFAERAWPQRVEPAGRVTRDRCYNFKIFSPKNLAKKLAFYAQNKAKLCKNWIITLVFEKNANFLQKIGKNRRKL